MMRKSAYADVIRIRKRKGSVSFRLKMTGK